MGLSRGSTCPRNVLMVSDRRPGTDSHRQRAPPSLLVLCTNKFCSCEADRDGQEKLKPSSFTGNGPCEHRLREGKSAGKSWQGWDRSFLGLLAHRGGWHGVGSGPGPVPSQLLPSPSPSPSPCFLNTFCSQDIKRSSSAPGVKQTLPRSW